MCSSVSLRETRSQKRVRRDSLGRESLSRGREDEDTEEDENEVGEEFGECVLPIIDLMQIFLRWV
jgi:hypothetical protein